MLDNNKDIAAEHQGIVRSTRGPEGDVYLHGKDLADFIFALALDSTRRSVGMDGNQVCQTLQTLVVNINKAIRATP